MPTYQVAVDVNTPPADTYTYVSDLTKHGEWTADPVQIRALTDGPLAVGHRYHSEAQVRGQTITAELQVTEHSPPSRFGFKVKDVTGDYDHLFSFEPVAGGTRITRRINASLSLPQALFFYLVYPFVKRPNAQEAMRRLKTKLDSRA